MAKTKRTAPNARGPKWATSSPTLTGPPGPSATVSNRAESGRWASLALSIGGRVGERPHP